MKSLNSTFLFKMQDKTVDLKRKLLDYNEATDNIPISMISEDLSIIQKRYNYPLKNRVIKDLTNNIVVPVYNKDRIKIPTFIPCYLYRNNKGDVIVVVNLTNHGRVNKDSEDYLDIDTKQLFSLLQTGTAMYSCFEKWNSISMNQTMCKQGSMLYSKMFNKIMDRMYAVNINPIKSDKIHYISAKFFLLNMMEKSASSDFINNIAYSCCSNGTTRSTIDNFNDDIDPEAFKSFDKFIKEVSILIEGFGSLTIRTFLDSAIKMYGTSTILAWEYYPMFLHTIFSVCVGAHMNSEFIFENLWGKDADNYYNEFVNITR